MSFFKRDSPDKKPELPQLPALPELPELPSLPQLPRASSGEALGIGAIKDSVSGLPPKKDYEIRKIDLTERRSMELPDMGSQRSMSSQNEPIFIKLDKFKEAVEKFSEIKEKVNDIEEALIKIKDVKDREAQELKSWEEEVQMIKEKVANIDVSLFQKI